VFAILALRPIFIHTGGWVCRCKARSQLSV